MNRPVIFVAALALAGLTACGSAVSDEPATDQAPADLSGTGLGSRDTEDDPDNWPEAGIPSEDFDQVVTEKEGMRRVISHLSNVDKALSRPNVPQGRAQQLRDHHDALRDAACQFHQDLDDRYEDVNLVAWGEANCPR